MGSGVGEGGCGSGPGPGGRGSGVGRWGMLVGYPRALNANGAPRRTPRSLRRRVVARLPESGGHPYDATFRFSPSPSAPKPTPTQLRPGPSRMSVRGPFALGLSADHGTRDVGRVDAAAAAHALGRRARAAVDVGVLAADGLAALGLLPGVLARVARRRLVVGADDAQRVLVG